MRSVHVILKGVLRFVDVCTQMTQKVIFSRVIGFQMPCHTRSRHKHLVTHGTRVICSFIQGDLTDPQVTIERRDFDKFTTFITLATFSESCGFIDM